MKIIFTILIALSISSIILFIRPDNETQIQELPVTVVITDTVKKITERPYTKITGMLHPWRQSTLAFEISGYVKKRNVESGQIVETGTTLLELKKGDKIDAFKEEQAKLKIEQYTLNLNRSLLELIRQENEIQEREVERLKNLVKDSVSSLSLYEAELQKLLQLQTEESRLQNQIQISKQKIARQQAIFSLAQRNLDRTKLTAPYTGIINAIFLDIGDPTTPTSIAVEMSAQDWLDLHIEIPHDLLKEIHLGDQIKVEISQQTRTGKIVALTTVPNTKTHTYPIKIRLSGADLFAGQIAQAWLPKKYYPDSVLIPASAVVHEEEQAFVYQINNNQVIKTPVTLRQRIKEYYATEDLSPNTVIASENATALSDGQTVQISQPTK